MKRFLVKPRLDKSVDELTFISRDARSSNRLDQLTLVRDIRARNPGQDDIDRRLREENVKGKEDFRLISDLALGASVTGTRIIEASEETAEQIEKDLGSTAHVIADQKLSLIEPTKRQGRRTDRLLDDQLWHLSAIGYKDARQRGLARSGEGVTVAVMDTGVQHDVPELEGRVHDSVRIDSRTGEIWQDLPSVDTSGHGTHVAGLICGKKVGVAPGAKVVNCTLLPNGAGTLSGFVLAIEWAASRSDIDIVNLSAGIPGYLSEMEDVIYGLLGAGILPVVAVGNEGRHRTRSPGNYRDVLSVGAATKNYKVTSFSGSANIISNGQLYSVPHLVAPGDSVYSCVRDGDYEAWDGSSMAAPIVSGIAALVLERRKEMSVLELMEIILDKCRDLHTIKERQGMGMVQVI